MGNQTSVTCTRERLSTPIVVGTARKEEIQLAEGLDAWEIKPRSDEMRHLERATVARPQQRRHIQTWIPQQTCCSRDTQNFNNPPRRRGGNHERNTTFGSGQVFLLPYSVDAWDGAFLDAETT